jgi:hypothetical protein
MFIAQMKNVFIIGHTVTELRDAGSMQAVSDTMTSRNEDETKNLMMYYMSQVKELLKLIAEDNVDTKWILQNEMKQLGITSKNSEIYFDPGTRKAERFLRIKTLKENKDKLLKLRDFAELFKTIISTRLYIPSIEEVEADWMIALSIKFNDNLK